MNKALAYAAFGWLSLAGVLHFMIDVVSQYLRGVREPSVSTSLYYGLQSSYALGQVLLGMTGLILAYRAFDVLIQWTIIALSMLAAIAWLIIGFMFIEYQQPKLMVAIFAVLLIAFAGTR